MVMHNSAHNQVVNFILSTMFTLLQQVISDLNAELQCDIVHTVPTFHLGLQTISALLQQVTPDLL